MGKRPRSSWESLADYLLKLVARCIEKDGWQPPLYLADVHVSGCWIISRYDKDLKETRVAMGRTWSKAKTSDVSNMMLTDSSGYADHVYAGPNGWHWNPIGIQSGVTAIVTNSQLERLDEVMEKCVKDGWQLPFHLAEVDVSGAWTITIINDMELKESRMVMGTAGPSVKLPWDKRFEPSNIMLTDSSGHALHVFFGHDDKMCVNPLE
jgi:hypothetical protein